MADGLTKALQKGKWSHFLAQIGLVDVNTQLEAQKQQEESREIELEERIPPE